MESQPQNPEFRNNPEHSPMLTLCVPMEFSIKFDTVKSGWSIIYIKGSKVIIS